MLDITTSLPALPPEWRPIRDDWRRSIIMARRDFKAINRHSLDYPADLPLVDGDNNPRWMIDTNGHLVVAKVDRLHMDFSVLATAPREWLAADMADDLELPIPPSNIVEAGPGEFFTVSLRAFPHSLCAPTEEALLHDPYLPLIAIYDQLIINPDRSRKNIVFEPEGEDKIPVPGVTDTAYIDHGRAFNRDKKTTFPILGTPTQGLWAQTKFSSTLLGHVCHQIRESPHVTAFIEKIERYPDSRIGEKLNRLPNGIFERTNSRARIAETTIFRRDNIRPIISAAMRLTGYDF